MLARHLKTFDDALVRMCYLLDTSLPSCKSVSSRADAFLSAMSSDIDLVQATADEVKNAVCLWDTLKDKPLHGKFVNWCYSGPIDLLVA